MGQLDAADREETLKLQAVEEKRLKSPDQQVSLTDPDARAMATSVKGAGTVGYNMQTMVDSQHHLIVTHEVTKVGHDRGSFLASTVLAGTRTRPQAPSHKNDPRNRDTSFAKLNREPLCRYENNGSLIRDL